MMIDAGEIITLPTYTISHIFTFLRSRDIIKCKYICKSWNALASEGCFDWFQVLALPIGDKGELDFDYLKPIKGGETVWFTSVNKQRGVPKSTIRAHQKYSFWDGENEVVSGTCYAPTKFLYRDGMDNYGFEISKKFLLEAIETCDKHPNLWRYELLRQHNNYNFPYVILLEVHIPQLGMRVASGLSGPLSDILSYSAYKYQKKWVLNQLAKVNYSAVRVPWKHRVTPKQPFGFAKSIKLHKYQTEAVNWMKSVELEVDIGYDLVHLIKWGASKNVMFEFPYRYQLVHVSKMEEHTIQVYPKGGILADDKGLGKTMEVIGLILAHPGNPINLDPTPYEVWINEMQVLHSLDDMDEADISQFKNLFSTNATLVICPDHLVKHWSEEIRKATRPRLNVVSIYNMASLINCLYGEIVYADVVVFAASLLGHISYLNLGKVNPYEDRKRRVNCYLKRLWQSGSDLLQVKGPVLEHFFWRRVVIDEAHDVVGDYWGIISTINADFWWYVSATPYSYTCGPRALCDVLHFPEARGVIQRFNFLEVCMKQLYWRNTKASIKNDCELPSVIEDMVMLDLTPIEKYCYIAGGNDQLLMTSHIGIGLGHGGHVTLTDLRAEVIKHLKTKIVTNTELASTMEEGGEAEIVVLDQNQFFQNTLTDLETSFYDGPDLEKEAVIPEINQTDPKALVAQIYSDLQRKLEIGSKVEHNTPSTTPPEEAKKRKPEESIDKSAKKPKVGEDKLTLEMDLDQGTVQTPETKVKEHYLLLWWVEREGTKLGNMIFYLKRLWEENPNAKLNILSRYSLILDKVSTILDGCKVHHAFADRNLQKQAFKKDNLVRVRLMNFANVLESSATIPATHVVFLEPAEGSPNQAKAQEEKAVAMARAYNQGQTITVVRFIVRSTEDIYAHKRIHYPDEIEGGPIEQSSQMDLDT